MKKAEVVNDDPIIYSLGAELGRYQFLLCMLIFMSKFPSGFVTLSHVFLATTVDTKCTNPANITDPCSADCKKVSHENGVFEENIITEWNLVCDRKYLANFSQTILMLGIMIGGILFGNLSDAFGRRWTFVAACLLNLISGCLVSVANSYWLYCVLRFIDAFAVGGMMVISIVIILEIVGKKYRELMSILYQLPFNVGHATLPAFAYFLRHWRWYHLGFSSVSILYVMYICVLPESPRWLMVKGKTDEAVSVLEKMATFSKKPTEHIRPTIEGFTKSQVTNAEGSPKRFTLIDLFRTPYLCLKTCTMAFNWVTVCLVYYGVSQYITALSGNIFLNVAIGACLGIPGTLICVPMTKYLGRKLTLLITNATSAVSLLLIAVTPKYCDMPLATIGLFGASITFPNVYLYSAEIFPTVLRNSGVGFCSFFGRVGSMCAPFIASLSEFGEWLPPAIFGGFSVASVVLTFFALPETRGALLPDTLADAENFGRKSKPSTQ